MRKQQATLPSNLFASIFQRRSPIDSNLPTAPQSSNTQSSEYLLQSIAFQTLISALVVTTGDNQLESHEVESLLGIRLDVQPLSLCVKINFLILYDDNF